MKDIKTAGDALNIILQRLNNIYENTHSTYISKENSSKTLVLAITNKQELLPCVMCGCNKITKEKVKEKHQVICSNCGIKSRPYNKLKDAIAEWNYCCQVMNNYKEEQK